MICAKSGQNWPSGSGEDWLIIIVLHPAQEYFTYMETSPLPVSDLI
jgi:hypothetical protein